jgi:hypothetical protein
MKSKKEFTLANIQQTTANNREEAIRKAINKVKFDIEYQSRRGANILNTDELPKMTYQIF